MADLRPVYVAGDGDVKGPASASNNFLPLFAGTTGKLLKSSGTGVTAQGLAILDDNTPAEQRNTIGLDQVNNTSDVNKPVSTAQQTALNLKQDKLLYIPVQQGGGIGQTLTGQNKVYIGWSDFGGVRVTVDQTDQGKVAFNLDSVDNTSDVNKPVSTAQQAALNLKMNRTGDGATPRLGAVSVNSSGLIPHQQGAYLFWNQEGNGRTSLVNNQWEGVGGFVFRNVNKNNTVETGRVTIDGSGSLSSTGNITAAGNIYGANGAVTIASNGNVHGSAWGGWLSEYIANAIATTLGYNQTWQNVTSSRTPGVIYTNTSGRPICVKVTHGEGGSYNRLYVDGLVVDESYLNTNTALFTTVSAIVPSGSTYQLFNTGETDAYVRWMELR